MRHPSRFDVSCTFSPWGCVERKFESSFQLGTDVFTDFVIAERVIEEK
jgi:hypothetical protein